MLSILPGLDALQAGYAADVLELIRNRRCGLVTNHTGVTYDGGAAVSVLESLGVTVSTFFSPEHGTQGNLEGKVDHILGGDRPTYSLYGETRRPTAEMLEGLDALIFDIQDVGARFYTYTSTLALCLEECAKYGIPLVVLDRPNPLGGIVDGPVVDEECRTFVGHVRLPIQHGLTPGEIALVHRADENLNVDVHVAKVTDWNRATIWPGTGLPWVSPSPNLPDYESARWYPGTCLIEFCDLSVGRGTDAPFQIVGAPWLDPNKLRTELERHIGSLASIQWETLNFTPTRATHQGNVCQGLRFSQSRLEPLAPVALGMALLAALHATHTEIFTTEQMKKSLPLLGSREVLDSLIANNLATALEISASQAEAAASRHYAFHLYP